MAQDFRDLWSLTGKYAALMAALFAVQMFPYTGLIGMMFGAMFWIPIALTVYFLHVLVSSLTGALPRWLVALPAMWFGAGAVQGLLSDYEVYSWLRVQSWAEVQKSVPPEVTRLHDPQFQFGFDPNGVLRPERKNFEIVSYSKFRGNKSWLPVSSAAKGCKPPLTMLGDRCFQSQSTEYRLPYIEIGQRSRGAALEMRFGSQITPEQRSIVLHTDQGQTIMGTLRGAYVIKAAYLLSPTATCWLDSSQAAWRCTLERSVFRRERGLGYGALSSRDTSAVLMKALTALRDGAI